MAGITVRIPKLDRTQRLWLRYLIADLEGEERIQVEHMQEALSYRAVPSSEELDHTG